MNNPTIYSNKTLWTNILVYIYSKEQCAIQGFIVPYLQEDGRLSIFNLRMILQSLSKKWLKWDDELKVGTMYFWKDN
jgi:hypothetical protein